MAYLLNHSIRRFIQTTARKASQVEGPSAVSGQHEGGFKVWRNLTFFVAFPSIALCAVNCVLTHQKHAAHPHRPEFVQYEHLRVRSKRFPWGEGNRSLFHNPHTNPLPNGYED
ncbi:hypothetical protein JTB14_030383 [Gonioctena quinquepunctata]|nr:hypothetical protein JTB14_030383 [Gonioctena quinquepunctata]